MNVLTFYREDLGDENIRGWEIGGNQNMQVNVMAILHQHGLVIIHSIVLEYTHTLNTHKATYIKFSKKRHEETI